jgi:flagellar motor switch/type III secretory pathway protein FliN
VITAMRFGPPAAGAGGRILRELTFSVRSTFPLQAACLVANGLREQLTRLLAYDFELDLVEPTLVCAQARRVLFASALVYRVRGRLCDAFIVLRATDARRLVAAAFGEAERPERDPLSEIERTTLERIIAAVAPLCAPLCGQPGAVTREPSERAEIESVTYFEVRTSGALSVAIGFALTRDPAEEVGSRLALDDLLDVKLEGTVECARGSIGVPAFAGLDAQTTLALETQLEAPGSLRFGDVLVARGICGAVEGRSTFVVECCPAGGV